MQGESEHRTSKRRYVWTDHKLYEIQIARIERCQANLHHIGEKLYGAMKQADDVAVNPTAIFSIGNSQNRFERIPLFLQAHKGDPAIKVSLDFKFICPDAKVHLEFYTKAEAAPAPSNKNTAIKRNT